MSSFTYRDGELFVEDIALRAIAEQYGTPCYVYSRAAFEQQYLAYTRALADQEHLICYAVKANSNIAVLNLLGRLGSGFDIVSGGELKRVLLAGGNPARVVFSGVAKTAEEMRQALTVGIHCFNLESEAELERLNQVAADMQRVANISIRVNPDVDANSHPYISTGLRENKFGIDILDAPAVYRRARAMDHINVIGVDCHIGSQLTELQPFIDALERVLQLVDGLTAEGITIEHLDLGGGLGVTYDTETPPAPEHYIAAILDTLGQRRFRLIFEPGRSIAANAGVLVTRVEYLKYNAEKSFAIVDAAMNDLIRPSLYQAWQSIRPLTENSGAKPCRYDVVGPVCETGDFLGKNRLLALEAGDLLAVGSAGAYGFSMSSNYNSRPRVAEVIVDGNRVHLVRARENFEDLVRGESLLPDDPSR